MASASGQAIYGLFRYRQDCDPIDRSPIRLPRVLGKDELESYEHAAIDASSQVRLLELLRPKKASAERNSLDFLRCKIHCVSLKEAPKYEALSYTWGKIVRHLPISVVRTGDQAEDVVEEEDDQVLFATPQLLMALKRLRLPSSSRFLWIDQLCIDQENEDEKGPQIQLMGEIYRKAVRVIVWLGEDNIHMAYTPIDVKMFEEGDSELLEGLIRIFKEDSCETPEHDLRLAEQLVDVKRTYHVNSIEQRRLAAVLELLNRPWFRRAWVFQEASLARELLIQYGPLEVPLEDLKRVLDAISALETEAGIQRWTSLAQDTWGYEMIQHIQTARQVMVKTQHPASSQTQSHRFLSTLFSVLRRVEAFDSRDLIFAFLAFQENEGITATVESYSQTHEDIWKQATERIIKASQSLDIFAGLSGDTERQLKLPSWVPYWSDCFPYSRPISTAASHFRAARGLPHIWKANSDPNKLYVQGKIIDSIKAFPTQGFSKIFTSSNQGTAYFLGWEGLLQGLRRYLYSMRDKLQDQVELKIETLERDVMRTVLADGTMGSQQPLRCVYEMLDANKLWAKARGHREAGRNGLTEEEKELLKDYEKLEDLVLVAESKRVFMTEYIQLGMVPVTAQIGDQIAIIHGSRVPCVLREVRGKSGEYRIISQCYLDGWMYGKTPNDRPHPHNKWWEEIVDEFIVV